MVLKINEEIETKVLVLDTNGNPANSKTITYRVFDEADNQFATDTMSEIGSTAIYTAAWTPDAVGEWTFQAYSDDPKFYKAFTYSIGKGVESDLITRPKGLDDIHDDLVTVLADTNELQIDDYPGRFDTLDTAVGNIPTTMVGTNSAALASVLGALNTAAAQDGDATTETAIALIKGLHDVLWDADGVAAFPSAVAPGNNVSIAEVLRSVYDDTHELQSDDYPTRFTTLDTAVGNIPTTMVGTNNAALASVLGALTDAAAQDGDATTSTNQSLLKGLHDVLWDSDGIAAWAAAAAPGNGVSIAEVLRSIYDDTNELQTDLVDGGRLDLLIDAVLLQTFNEPFAFNPQSQSVTQDTEKSLDAPGTKTITFPTNATLKKATLFAGIKANNQSATEHNIGLTLQYNYAAGGWTDVSTMDALLTNPHLTLPSTDATGDKTNVGVDVTSVIAASGNTITFRWQVDSDDDGEVHYLSTFILVATYDFSGL